MPIPGMDSLVDRLLAAQAGNPAPIESREDLIELIEDMDLLYWNEVEMLLADAARRGGQRLEFGKNERLLLDAGLVDARLLEGGAATARAALLRELYSPADAGGSFYFTEWLNERYSAFVRTPRPDEETASRPGVRSGEVAEARRRIYERLAPALGGLPEATPRAVEMLVSGRLDAAIDEMTPDDDALQDKRQRLVELRSRLLAGARTRLSPGERPLLEFLDRLERMAETPVPPPAEPPRLTPGDRVRFLMGELQMVRSVVKLGIAGSGLARTHSVLISPQERMSRADLAAGAATIRISDPSFLSLNFMIAPYVGTGFYSFDRDLLFVPLVSTRSKEDSMANAVAQYRVLLDGLNDDGAVKKAYEDRFGRKDFRSEFTRDYKSWLLGIGRGFRGALDPDRYGFFKEHVGPQARDLFAPAAMTRQTPEEHAASIRSVRERIARGYAVAHDHYRLAITAHRDGRTPEAMEAMETAARLSPMDGRLLFAQGFLLAQTGHGDRARPVLEECEALAQGTLWAVYATEELQKL